MTREDHIDQACDRDGCSDKERRYHARIFLSEHWDPHPPSEFNKWFEPSRIDPVLGSIGGHPEARRAFLDPESPDEQRPDFIWDGAKASTAWNSAFIRDQFNRRHSKEVEDIMWKPFVGTTKERQERFSSVVRQVVLATSPPPPDPPTPPRFPTRPN